MSYEEEAGHPEAILVIQRSIIHEAEGVFGRLHPLASDLAAEMANFAHDIESVTGTAIAEKAMLDQENARLSSLIINFQQRIQKFLTVVT